MTAAFAESSRRRPIVALASLMVIAFVFFGLGSGIGSPSQFGVSSSLEALLNTNKATSGAKSSGLPGSSENSEGIEGVDDNQLVDDKRTESDDTNADTIFEGRRQDESSNDTQWSTDVHDQESKDHPDADKDNSPSNDNPNHNASSGQHPQSSRLPLLRSGQGKDGLVEAEGDAAGIGPRYALLRTLVSIVVEDDGNVSRRDVVTSSDNRHALARSFLEYPDWKRRRINTRGVPPSAESSDDPLLSRWRVTYNRSLSRPVPKEYIEGSKLWEPFFTAIEARDVLPKVVNSSMLVDGSLEGEDSIKLADLRGIVPSPSGRDTTSSEEGNSGRFYFDPVETEEEETARFDKIANSNAFARTIDDLEFVKSVPAVHTWLRPLNETVARWSKRDDEVFSRLWNVSKGGKGEEAASEHRLPPPRPAGSRSAVRIACLYAGFVRDYVRMFISCLDKVKSHKKCRDKYINKLYGSQRENIIDSSGCDVYSSTWDIVGTGRYDVKDYKMDQKFDIRQLKLVYGDRLGGLHVQKYAVYERVWKYMATRARSYPQTRPTHSTKLPATWRGEPENNFIFRVNDYSQSYKHWCVVQLALLSGFNYDVFFRLRMDLRAVREIGNFRFASIVSSAPLGSKGDGDGGDGAEGTAANNLISYGRDEAKKHAHHHQQQSVLSSKIPFEKRVIAYDVSSFKEEGGSFGGGSNGGVARLTHYIGSSTMHVQNFDYADFGFMASPSLIHSLAAVWYYCLMPAVKGLPIQYLSQHLKPASEVISEYNLVVWRVIWENKMLIDNGGIVLRISRRANVKGKPGRRRKR